MRRQSFLIKRREEGDVADFDDNPPRLGLRFLSMLRYGLL